MKNGALRAISRSAQGGRRLLRPRPRWKFCAAKPWTPYHDRRDAADIAQNIPIAAVSGRGRAQLCRLEAQCSASPAHARANACASGIAWRGDGERPEFCRALRLRAGSRPSPQQQAHRARCLIMADLEEALPSSAKLAEGLSAPGVSSAPCRPSWPSTRDYGRGGRLTATGLPAIRSLCWLFYPSGTPPDQGAGGPIAPEFACHSTRRHRFIGPRHDPARRAADHGSGLYGLAHTRGGCTVILQALRSERCSTFGAHATPPCSRANMVSRLINTPGGDRHRGLRPYLRRRADVYLPTRARARPVRPKRTAHGQGRADDITGRQGRPMTPPSLVREAARRRRRRRARELPSRRRRGGPGAAAGRGRRDRHTSDAS